MKPIEDIDYILGLKVERDRMHKKIILSQETYANKVLEWFGITNCSSSTYLVTSSATLEAHKGAAAAFLYFQGVESVMCIAMGTQPDLALGVGLVSCFASNLGEVHVKAVKRILGYLQATTDIT